MNRSELREHIFRMLFRIEFNSEEEMKEQEDLYFELIGGVDEQDMTYIYNEVFSMEKEQIESLKKDLLRKYKTAQDTFGDADEEDQANLKRFSFICLLSFDVYVKKMMIEHIIDGMNPESEHNSKKKK